MHIDRLPRFPLAQLPTPLESLPRLSRVLCGPELLVKRDDQTGLAFGGNKARKLEFLVGQALDQGADTLVTAGAVQSNHCRQTAAAAAKAGLKCELILNGEKPAVPNGNLLLDRLLGATEHWIDRSQRSAKVREISERLRSEGRKPYVMPVGGSNGVGATGYVVAMIELMSQLMARCEGILLDPVYAGRAFGGLVDLIRKGIFKRGETVLFWHTGGSPALFAYAREIIGPNPECF